MTRVAYWNHNVHYQPVILAAVPAGCATALDVGCGDGMLACRLAERCAEVTGIDRDARMIAAARARARAQAQAQRQEQQQEPHQRQESHQKQEQQQEFHPAAPPGRVRFIEANFLACSLETASFEFVCANTSLHHMDFAAALTAMTRALQPGGSLAVIGLAADRSVSDYLAAAPGVPVDLFYRAVYRRGESGAPIKDPDMSWAEIRTMAGRLLPGVRYRRHLLWRKPA